VRPNGRAAPTISIAGDPHLRFDQRPPGACWRSTRLHRVRLVQPRLESRRPMKPPYAPAASAIASWHELSDANDLGRRQGQPGRRTAWTAQRRAPAGPAPGCGGSLNPCSVWRSNWALGPCWLPWPRCCDGGHDGALTVAMRRARGLGRHQRGESIESILDLLRSMAMGQPERQPAHTTTRSPKPL